MNNLHDDDRNSITINDVARVAGVSVSTVSRILNDKPDVSTRTRKRVLSIIEQLGYAPNSQAQRLRAGKSRMISLLFPIEHTEFTQLELGFFIGAATAAGEREYLFNLMTTPVDNQHLAQMYHGGQVDGVILMQIKLQDERVKLLQEQGHLFVMVGRCEDNTGLSYIDSHFEAYIRVAFEYLLELGHQNIGYLTRPAELRQQQLGSAVRCMEGYVAVCDQYQLPKHYREVNLTVQDMQQATLDLLQESPDLTAIVTVNGATAAGIVDAIHETGRRIPEDISVIAISTGRVAQIVRPPLTTIDIDPHLIGYQAAEMLINRLESDSTEVAQILLEPQLIVRESTAPASVA